MKRLYYQGLSVWLILAFLAIVNGSIRNFFYAPLVGELAGHQISAFMFIAVIFAVVYVFLKARHELPSKRELWILGIMWVSTTIAFEFIFGHYVVGHPWEKLLHDYDLLAGRLWILVLIAIAIAPAAVGKLLSGRAQEKGNGHRPHRHH